MRAEAADGRFARVQPAADARPRRDVFFALAVAFLALPNLIFLLGWLRPVWGIPAALIVTGAAGWLIRQNKPAEPARPLTPGIWAIIVLAAGAWTLLAGVGGVFPQTPDYTKHTLLLHDLATMAWPVNYHYDLTSVHAGDYYLCYGLGYYLVPGLGGRILGFGAVPVLTVLWTFAGLVLVFQRLASLSMAPVKTLLTVMLFATTGVVWWWFKRHGLPGLIRPDGLEARLLQAGLCFNYHDSFTRFNYQPQHALVGWLGAVFLFERLWIKGDPRGVVLLWAACLLWSPLTCLGLLLIPLAAIRRVRWQDYFEPVNLLGGGVLIVIMGLYFTGHVALADAGFIWKFAGRWEWPVFYLLFLLLTMSPLLFMALIDWKYRVLGEWRPLFYTITAVLVLMPLYKFGFANDLRFQAGSPGVFILALCADRMLRSGQFSWKKPLFQCLVVSLLLGAVYPVTRPWINLRGPAVDYSYAHIVETTGAHNLSEMRDVVFDAAPQYLGRNDSVAARWLLR